MTHRPPQRDTIAVHAGRGDGAPGDALNVPVWLASVYHAGMPIGYARAGNPNWSALEAAVGQLEGGTARAFASGMGGIAAVVETLAMGAAIVYPEGAYTGTRALLAALDRRGRLQARGMDVADTAATLAAVGGLDGDGPAAMLWVESPTNPMMAVADLPALIAGGHAAGATVVVDNTFATPLRQQPLALGADVVVHSATKFIAGHSDLLLGIVVTQDEQLVAALDEQRTLRGAAPGPMETWLALRGLRTLPVRIDRAEATAGELARRLDTDRRVTRVRYPGLPNDPGHARAAAQMSGFGAILSFEIDGDADGAEALCAATRLAIHATSLGGVETTLERRAKYSLDTGTPEALIRLSVGLEDLEDLWADLDAALHCALGPRP